ncbi:hypothetical protein EI94DRAFT_1701348 [Lactarius quietus]|nr:hypothetical protein EI94DRAFT_1701348 [Lactarius quietus]
MRLPSSFNGFTFPPTRYYPSRETRSSFYRLEAMGQRSHPSPPLSPSDDLKPLPPSQQRSRSGMSRIRRPLAPAHALLGWYHCGQSCCLLWQTAVNPGLTPPGGQVGEEESGAGWEWQTCPSSNPGGGEPLWLHVEVVAIYKLESMGRCSYHPPPLSPSDNLRPLPPTETCRTSHVRHLDPRQRLRILVEKISKNPILYTLLVYLW